MVLAGWHGSGVVSNVIHNDEVIMDIVEQIRLRVYSPPDKDAAIAAFHQITLPEREKGFECMHLLNELSFAGDLCIFIHWQKTARLSLKGKSPLGIQLAAAFSKFGRINHSIWTNITQR